MTARTRLSAFLVAILFAGFGGCDATTICCDELEAATSSDKVLRSNTTEYESENSKYWSLSCVLTPQCVFVPTSASDVSAAVKALTRNSCQFAVRGGGHTPNPGWAGTSSGVLISLSKLNTVQVSNDTNSVVVGAGNHWGNVYTETDKYGVTVAGGRIASVGVSGFLLGGGLSFLMHQVGFGANNVLAYEIVLADGSVVDVTEASHPDLFKGLKGGSGNFGIVTNFLLKTYPVKNVYAGNLYYSTDQYDNLLPLVEAYARGGAESDPKSHIISSFASLPSQSINVGGFYAFYSDPVTAPPPAFKPFVDLPTMVNTLKVKTAKEATDELSAGNLEDLRFDMRAYSVRADAALFKKLLDAWQAASDGLNSTSGWFASITFQPISNNMIRASEERGGNVLGLQPMDDPLIIVSYQFTWGLATDDTKVYAVVDKLVEDSEKVAQSESKLADYIYLNYAGANQRPLESYGQHQVDFLKSVKAKYDPDGVFTKLSPGGFKIPL